MATIVYKYRLWAPTTNAVLVEETFLRATDYYNELVAIENTRRDSYRRSRTELFPDLEKLEAGERELTTKLKDLRSKIKSAHSESRARTISPDDLSAALAIKEELASVRRQARAFRSTLKAVEIEESTLPKIAAKRAKLEEKAAKCQAELASLPDSRPKAKEKYARVLTWCSSKLALLDTSHCKAAKLASKSALSRSDLDASRAALLMSRSAEGQAVADQHIKDLRRKLYWGTYLLVEDAVKRAKKMNPGRLRPKSLPEHQQPGRIGIQLQGGVSVAESANDSRIRLRPDGRNGTFSLRIGTADNNPIWADFPLRMHRPLPDDAQIMWAVVTRVPGHLLRPWIYHLCLTVRTSRTVVTHNVKKGTAAVNFGWRLVGDGAGRTLRVATLQTDASSIEHVELPAEIYGRFDKCRGLQATIDDNFNEIKKKLSTWIAGSPALHPAFLESFENLPQWHSPRKLFELVGYWRLHRLDDDESIFAKLWYWRGRWFHLYQWLTCNRQKALRGRLDFYRKWAARVASTTECVILEDFNISQVAERPKAEKEDDSWQKARENRTRASCHELRTMLIQACAKYHTTVKLVPADHNTLRCNVCGKVLNWDPARDLVRDCPGCSTWDQDVNNTDNAHDRAASGEVATLVEPAVIEENRKVSPAVVRSFSSARKDLPKTAESRR